MRYMRHTQSSRMNWCVHCLSKCAVFGELPSLEAQKDLSTNLWVFVQLFPLPPCCKKNSLWYDGHDLYNNLPYGAKNQIHYHHHPASPAHC